MNAKKSSENYLRQFFSIYLARAIFLHLVILNFYVPKWKEVSDGTYCHVAKASLNIVLFAGGCAAAAAVAAVPCTPKHNTHRKNIPRNWAFNVIKTLIMLINQNGILYFIFRVQQFFSSSSSSTCTSSDIHCTCISIVQNWCLRSIWTRNHCVSHFIASSRKPLSPHEVLNAVNDAFKCTHYGETNRKLKMVISRPVFAATPEPCIICVCVCLQGTI